MSGLDPGSQDHRQERQGSVLTDQCLGKETNTSEELRNPSSLTDSDKFIAEQRDMETS
jgi:hypothetical protein